MSVSMRAEAVPPAAMPQPLRVVSIVEGRSITGPLKPLLMLIEEHRRAGGAGPRVDHTLLTTERPALAAAAPNLFHAAARERGIELDVVTERFAGDLWVLGPMAEALARRKPDIVETHDFKCHFLFRLLRRRSVEARRARWIAYHHGYTRMTRRVLAYQQLDRWSLPRADRVVTLCRPFVEDLVARGVPRERIEVLTNAVEPRPRPPEESLAALRQALGIEPRERVILCVGRISAEKGQEHLLEAFRRLLGRPGVGTGLRLLLVGDGHERERLQALAADLGKRVVFTGHQADPWPYFGIADAFVLPSETEGSPLVLFEAMSAALPIVATRVGGVPEVVEDGDSALLVPPGEVVALTSAMERLLAPGSTAARLGARARAAVEQFTPANYRGRVLDIYTAAWAVGASP